MKIAFVFPRYKYPSGDIPLGIGYIVSYLKKNTNCKIDVIDATFKNSYDYVIRKVKKNNYDLVCFSLMTTMLSDSIKLAEIIRKIKPKTKILFGGPHPTVMPAETMENTDIDAICIGEGEETLLELVKNKLSFKGINGIWYRENGKTIKNPPRAPIEDLDKLPYPARNMFNMKKYFSYWFQLDSVARNLKGVNIISSRGCPYQCTYCQPTLERIFGKKIRKRSPKNIADELEYLKKRYGINAFMFQDDTLIFDKKWVSKICDELIKRNLNLIWGCNARVNLVDKKLFSKMKKAGLKKIFIGIESASQRILDKIYNKQITLKQVKDAVKIFRELELKVQGFFMLGAPTETEAEIEKTINFAKNLDIDEATFSITTPLPHTYLYEKTKDKISKDVNEFDYYKKCVYRHDNFSEKRLNFLKKKALLYFYLAPKRILATTRGFITPIALIKSLTKLRRF